jgi:predicted nucleic acid-binding protein
VIVVDASVLTLVLGDRGPRGTAASARLHDEEPVAPDLIHLEVASALRRLERAGAVTDEQAVVALLGLLDLDLEVFPLGPLVARAWALRHNLTPYDAAYVALAESLDCPLVTADRGLASSPGLRCTVELI